jgi:hypothetical protein
MCSVVSTNCAPVVWVFSTNGFNLGRVFRFLRFGRGGGDRNCIPTSQRPAHGNDLVPLPQFQLLLNVVNSIAAGFRRLGTAKERYYQAASKRRDSEVDKRCMDGLPSECCHQPEPKPHQCPREYVCYIKIRSGIPFFSCASLAFLFFRVRIDQRSMKAPQKQPAKATCIQSLTAPIVSP